MGGILNPLGVRLTKDKLGNTCDTSGPDGRYWAFVATVTIKRYWHGHLFTLGVVIRGYIYASLILDGVRVIIGNV
jgi:hypothetical protein